MPARTEKVVASEKGPRACLGLEHRGLGVGGSKVAQRRENMDQFALEVQIPADDLSDKSLRVTEEKKGHVRVWRSCWDKSAGNQIVKKSWSGQTMRLSWASDPVSVGASLDEQRQ